MVPALGHNMTVRLLTGITVAAEAELGVFAVRRVVLEDFLSVRSHLRTDSSSNVPSHLFPILAKKMNRYKNINTVGE